ncbi:MAG TPA: MDR family MFS transporter [Stellaceae bacterium]|nr:MDR family MFS transporter [Stellaceae bacterium]
MAEPAAPQSAARAQGAAPGEGVAPGSRRSWVLAATIATIMISAIEGTIIATVMPTIVSELGGFDLFSWAFTAYLLTQGVTAPIYGRLADIYGRKRVLLTAIGLFLVASVLCGFAWSMMSLIAFRVLQGIGAGGLVPVVQTIIGDLFTPAERARIQGWISSVWAMGAIIGPLLGAFLVAHSIWPMVFWVNVPIGVVAAAMLVVSLHERLEPHPHRIDYLGSALMMLGTGLLMLALVDAARLPLGAIAGLIAAAAIVLTLFVLHERRTPEPMLPLGLWVNGIVAGGNVTGLGLGAVMMGTTAFLSLYVQGVMGRSAIIAGVALAASSVSWPLGSTAGGRLMLRTSYRATTVVGALPLLAGSLMMIALEPSRGPLWATAAAALIGIGMGFTNNTFQVAIQSVVDWRQRGIATSSMVFSRIIGQALGAAVFGGLINASLPPQLTGAADRVLDPNLRSALPPAEAALLIEAIAHGLHNVYLITGFVVLVVAAMALLLPPGLSPIRPARAPR